MKVVTLQQMERDLDRILDDVIDQQEHYTVKISWVSNFDSDHVWEEKAVVVIPTEDYEVMSDVYEEWLEEIGIKYPNEEESRIGLTVS